MINLLSLNIILNAKDYYQLLLIYFKNILMNTLKVNFFGDIWKLILNIRLNKTKIYLII